MAAPPVDCMWQLLPSPPLQLHAAHLAQLERLFAAKPALMGKQTAGDTHATDLPHVLYSGRCKACDAAAYSVAGLQARLLLQLSGHS